MRNKELREEVTGLEKKLNESNAKVERLEDTQRRQTFNLNDNNQNLA